jgi:hypothetical protein
MSAADSTVDIVVVARVASLVDAPRLHTIDGRG